MEYCRVPSTTMPPVYHLFEPLFQRIYVVFDTYSDDFLGLSKFQLQMHQYSIG